MTTIIGLRTNDFIIIGADSQVTKGNLKLPFEYNKVQHIASCLIAGCGSVGFTQRVLNIALKNLRINKIASDNLNLDCSVSELARNIAELNFSMPLEHKNFNPYSFLIAGLTDENDLNLISIGDDGSIISVPTFYSEGSGSDYALSILSEGYKPEIEFNEAVNLVKKALSQSNKLDIYTDSNLKVMAIYEKDGDWVVNSF